ncbi:MAG: hypothetical protein ABSA75_03465 [Candidatus Bathyarchaeia archaeon]
MFAESLAGSDLQLQGLEKVPDMPSRDVASEVSPTVPSHPNLAFTVR